MERMVTIEKAIAAIKTAAEEIPAEDFLSYSTILDVHLSFAHEFFSPDEQHQLLETLAEILDTHEELARDISWDLVSVLLPFLESLSPTTLETTKTLITSAAAKGNPREVFIKVLESLSSLNWASRLSTEQQDEAGAIDEDGGKVAHSGDESDDENTEKEDREGDKLSRKHSLEKFHALLSALSIVHPRIAAKLPSRFLSTELTTLQRVFMKSVQWLERQEVDGILRAILEFVEVVKPELSQAGKQSLAKGQKPPLPPRVPTAESLSSLLDAPTEDSPEVVHQARLLQSFLSHILEIYLLSTRTWHSESPTNYSEKGHYHGHARPAEDLEERGLVLGWAGSYDEEVVRKEKSKVPGGKTLIDDERAARAGRGDVRKIVKDIAALCEGLGLQTDELLRVCGTVEGLNENVDEEAEHTDVPAPAYADEVPLSKVGFLFLLAERFTTVPVASIAIFPDHEKISRNFLVLGSVQTQPPVVDAVLFLGAFALYQGGGLGEVPVEIENFLMYLQTFAAISATASSPQTRFLSHYHVATVLKQHPDEAVRLAYIKDTLEHCPFESLKERAVLILKDEIIYATSPPGEARFDSSRHKNTEYLVCTACGHTTARKDNMADHVKRKHPDLDLEATMQEIMIIARPGISDSESSIFGSLVVLEELFPVLFPDVGEFFSGTDTANWEAFKNHYPTLVATLNFYYFLLKSPYTQDRLGIRNKEHAGKVENRFLHPLAKAVEGFKVRGNVEGTDGSMKFELDILTEALERVADTKKSVIQ